MKSGRRVHSSMAALAMIASLSGCGLHGKPTVERKAAPTPGGAGPSSAARAEAVDPVRVIAPGIVESWGGDTQLSAKESGWIDRVLVREGDHVAWDVEVAARPGDRRGVSAPPSPCSRSRAQARRRAMRAAAHAR